MLRITKQTDYAIVLMSHLAARRDSVANARELFHKAPGLELWEEGEITPSTRDAAGRDVAG